ncbi:hypothetical protein AAY473_036666 [Plecturocebus cupreus]
MTVDNHKPSPNFSCCSGYSLLTEQINPGWVCDGVSLYHPGWSAVARSRLTVTSHLPGSNHSPASVSQVVGITGVRHHARLICVFLVEIRFHHVGQAGLELLTSETGSCYVAQTSLELLSTSDPPALASQSAGMTLSVHCLKKRRIVLYFQMRFHHVGQAGLELLTSGDLPILASQSAGIKGSPAVNIIAADVQPSTLSRPNDPDHPSSPSPFRQNVSRSISA